MSSSTASA
jgi:hypothetical protein